MRPGAGSLRHLARHRLAGAVRQPLGILGLAGAGVAAAVAGGRAGGGDGC